MSNSQADSLVSRVNGLAQRAAHESTPIEEARTAGVLLAKLMVKHALSIGTSNPDAMRQLAELRQANATLATQNLKLQAELAMARQGTQSKPSQGAWKRITARFDSKCPACAGHIEMGEPIMYRKGSRAVHVSCLYND